MVAAAAQLASIVDHSFEGVTGATLNRGRFVRENIAIMKGRTVDFLNRNEHRMSANPFVIANGTLAPVQVNNVQVSAYGTGRGIDSIITSLDVASLATAKPNDIFPNYVAGVQTTVIFIRYKKADVLTVVDGSSTYKYPSSTYVDKARFVFNPNSDENCFVAAGQGSTFFTLNPNAINAELSLNWQNLVFFVSDGQLCIVDPLANGTGYELMGGAVIMSERTSASHRYSRSIMFAVDEITDANDASGIAGNPLSVAAATFEDGGGSEVYPSDRYLNNADNL